MGSNSKSLGDQSVRLGRGGLPGTATPPLATTLRRWERRRPGQQLRKRSAARFTQRLDVVELGLDRVIAVVDQHVLRDSVIEQAHTELVVWFFDAGGHREEGQPNAPAGPLQQGAELYRCWIGGDPGPDRRRNLDGILVGRPVEHLAREKVLSLAGLIDQQDRVRAGEQNPGIELQGLRLRLGELDAAALSWTIELRRAADVLIGLAVSGLLLIKAVAQPVL